MNAGKDDFIENLQKALDDQLSTAEVQNEQNAIYRKEYELAQSDIIKISLENTNLRKCFEDGGAWIRNKQEEICAMGAALEDKDDEIKMLGLSVKDNEKKFSDFERETQEKSSCKVCMEDDISVSVVFLPCGHLCCCSNCASKPAVKNCPICRVIITKKLTVFQS